MLKFNIKEHKIEELIDNYKFKKSKCYLATDKYSFENEEQIFVDLRDYSIALNGEEDCCIEYILPLLYDLIKDGLIIKE